MRHILVECRGVDAWAVHGHHQSCLWFVDVNRPTAPLYSCFTARTRLVDLIKNYRLLKKEIFPIDLGWLSAEGRVIRYALLDSLYVNPVHTIIV